MGDYIGCNDSKKELIFYEIGQRSYNVAGKVGELLIDFLSLDFTVIEKIRLECLESLKKRRESHNEDNIDLAGAEAFNMMLKLDAFYITHPYFDLPTSSLYTFLNEEKKDEYNLTFIAQKLSEALNFCCNTEYNKKLNSLTALQRYYIYLEQSFESGHEILFNTYRHNIKTSFSLNDSNFVDKLSSMLFNENFEYILSPLSDKFIDFIKTQEIIPAYLYQAETVFDFLFFEFIKMIELNVQIGTCKNCGKYFILKGDYNTDYCDRIPDGEKFTCKKIAAMRTRKKKVQNNPILKEYEKAYKRMYARLSNHKLSNEDFRLWVEDASRKRDSVAAKYSSSPSDNIVNQFKEYLGNK